MKWSSSLSTSRHTKIKTEVILILSYIAEIIRERGRIIFIGNVKFSFKREEDCKLVIRTVVYICKLKFT